MHDFELFRESDIENLQGDEHLLHMSSSYRILERNSGTL